jgi:hypothetical protein
VTVYWFLFSFFAIGALVSGDGTQSLPSKLGLTLGGIILTLAIGLRFHVGGDWGAYQLMFSRAALYDYNEMLRFGDPAYQLLNWAVQRLEWPFWVVNLVCAAIFCWGLIRFATSQSNPWLAMVIAVPYLAIVVSMGYTRQAVAIGVIMMGLAAIQRGASILRFAIYVFIAALFHKTAVVAMLFVALTGERGKIVNLMIVLASAVLLYDSLLQNSMQGLLTNYVDAKYGSQGALIRISMCLVPAVLFLSRKDKFAFSEQGQALWRNISWTAFLLLVALVVSPSSTAVDRIALYVLPLQLAIFAQVPRTFSSPAFGRILIIVYAFAIQFAWLYYAANSYYWVPYSSYVGLS